MNEKINAKLYSCERPDEKRWAQIIDFIKENHGEAELEFVCDKSIVGGFRLEVGSWTYDWTKEGRMRQLKNAVFKSVKNFESKEKLVSLIGGVTETFSPRIIAEEVGIVKRVHDSIAFVSGLDRAGYGEILVFESGVRGIAWELSDGEIGSIIFENGDKNLVKQGSYVKRTGLVAGMKAGDDFIGRVVDPFGNPIDELGEINYDKLMPIESDAPKIVDRESVNRPLETGILVLDSLFPIGRGQRELIIGDRQTGKTTIAIDTIINQKGKDVICIYVAIGQKASSIAGIVNKLKEHGAMDHTIVVATTASDGASTQYIAPYSGCALAEYFMEQGKDVLIVYDDLSKHAVAYRALSLLLERSPGREAYPGDVFYLHSRLLERSAQLNDLKGGGSISALPIVETLDGDVSAYIPTNIISITDGQIFLESDLFFNGQRPAVNIGLSVSRVGSDAQTKAMKAASGTLRVDLAQYREMEVFNRFMTEIDTATEKQLKHGRILMKLITQKQHSPLSRHEQVITLSVANRSRIIDEAVEKSGIDVREYVKKMIAYFEKEHKQLCDDIDNDMCSSEVIDIIVQKASEAVI